MKTLIAVVTARHRGLWREAIRSTWLPFVPQGKADVRFFMGRGDALPLQPDEVTLECEDSYMGLPDKIREITRWSLAQDYDFMLKCDDDVVLVPDKLLACGYENHKYSGKKNRQPCPQHKFAVPVGFNYWLSKESMRIVSQSELPENDNDDEKWVAGNLYAKGIELHDDRRYEIYGGEIPDTRPASRLHRPLRPPKIEPKDQSEVFSWTVFLEANSGNGIPIEKKIEEFRKVFSKMYTLKSIG